MNHPNPSPLPAHPGAAGDLRPPTDGECRFCGATPATDARFIAMTSVVVFYVLSTLRGWMCRSCGLATFREQQARTLVRCWWGVSFIGAPLMLLANWLRLRRVLRLDPPRPTAGVAAPAAGPLDPGKPVLARPAGIVGILLGAVALLVVAFVVVSIVIYG